MGKLKIKTGDTVRVIAGDHKGSEGKVLTVFIEKNKAIVEGINMIKKHMKPTKENKGGIISKESFIHQSNVKNIDVKKNEKKVESKK